MIKFCHSHLTHNIFNHCMRRFFFGLVYVSKWLDLIDIFECIKKSHTVQTIYIIEKEVVYLGKGMTCQVSTKYMYNKSHFFLFGDN